MSRAHKIDLSTVMNAECRMMNEFIGHHSAFIVRFLLSDHRNRFSYRTGVFRGSFCSARSEIVLD